MKKMNQSIEIDISEIIFSGFSSIDGIKINNDIKQELTWLISEYGIPTGITDGQEISVVKGSTIKLSANSGTNNISKNIAASVYNGLIIER